MHESDVWRHWSELGPDEQRLLREAFGHYLDGRPPTCDLGLKIERFRDWLSERRVRNP